MHHRSARESAPGDLADNSVSLPHESVMFTLTEWVMLRSSSGGHVQDLRSIHEERKNDS